LTIDPLTDIATGQDHEPANIFITKSDLIDSCGPRRGPTTIGACLAGDSEAVNSSTLRLYDFRARSTLSRNRPVKMGLVLRSVVSEHLYYFQSMGERNRLGADQQRQKISVETQARYCS